MDAFDDLLFGGAPSAAPQPAPIATGFGFLGAAGPQPNASSSFSFMSVPAPNAAAPPIPAPIDSISGAFGGVTLNDTPLAQLGASAAVDYATLSAGALKKALDAAGVSHRDCVEKAELVALARARLGGGRAAPLAGAALPAAGSGGGARSAMAIGLPNAFALHGLGAAAADAARSIDQQRQYDAGAATSGALGDASSFFAAARRVPIASLVVPTMPPLARLRLRLPPAVFDPVLREVPPSYALRDCVSDISPAVAASSGAARAAAVALTPWGGRQVVGPKRYFELVVRPDASNRSVLDAVAGAGRSVGLDAVYSTARSVLLQQRVSVPSAAFSAFAASPAAEGLPQTGRTPVLIAAATAGGGAAAASGASGGWFSGLLARSTVYVNCVSCCVGANPAGERVLLLATARFLPDSTAAASAPSQQAAPVDAPAAAPAAAGGAAAPAAGASGGGGGSSGGYHGRLITKTGVGGAPVVDKAAASKSGSGGAKSAASATAAAAAAAAAALFDLSAASGGGIECVLASKRRPPTHFKTGGAAGAAAAPGAAATQRDGAAAAALAPSSSASAAVDVEDVFGLLSAPPAAAAAAAAGDAAGSEEGEGGWPGRAQAALSPAAAAEAALSHVQPYAGAPVDLADAANAADALVAALVGEVGEETADPAPGMDDGSEPAGLDGFFAAPGDEAPAGGSSGPLEWSALRVSFLDVERTAAAGAPAHHPPPATAAFPLSAVADELVALTCELASALRAERVLAESVWVDALSAAKRDMAAERGEEQQLVVVGGGAGLQAGAAAAAAGAAAGRGAPAPATPSAAASAQLGGLAPKATLDDALSMLDDALSGADAPTGSTVAAAPPTAEGHAVDAFAAQVAARAAAAAPAAAPAARKSLQQQQQAAALGGADEDASAPSPSTARPLLLPHPDHVAVLRAALRTAGEATLFTAAGPYEAAAKAAEALAAAVGRAVAPAFAAHKAAPDASLAPEPPRLDQLAMPPLPAVLLPPGGAAAAVAATPQLLDDAGEGAAAVEPPAPTGAEQVVRGYVLRGRSGGNPQPPPHGDAALLPALPSGAAMTATDETLRRVYHRAYLVTRALAHAAATHAQASGAATELELARRLARKKRHVCLRIASVFYRSVSLLSQLQTGWGVPSPAAALSGGALAGLDAGRALLASGFGVHGEAALAHVSVSAAKQLGEVVVTPARLVFAGSGVLGVGRVRRNIPFEAVVAVRRSAGANTLTIVFVDDEKRAAAGAVVTAAKTAAAAKVTAAVTAAAAAPAAASSSTVAAGAGGAGGVLFAGGPLGSPAPPPAPAISVQAAFDDLCELGGGEEAPALAAPAVAAPAGRSAADALAALTGASGAAPKAAATAAAAAAASQPPASAIADGALTSDELEEEDFLVLTSAGGSLAGLSALHVAPVPGAAVSRDELLVLLRLLRQLSARPHLRAAAFEPHPGLPGTEALFASSGAAAPASGARAHAARLPPLPRPLAVPDYAAWLAAHHAALAAAAGSGKRPVDAAAAAAAATAAVPAPSPPARPMLYGVRFADAAQAAAAVAGSAALRLGSLSSAGAALAPATSSSATPFSGADEMMDLFAAPTAVVPVGAASGPGLDASSALGEAGSAAPVGDSYGADLGMDTEL